LINKRLLLKEKMLLRVFLCKRQTCARAV